MKIAHSTVCGRGSRVNWDNLVTATMNIYLCEYSFDGLCEDVDLFRDVLLDDVNECVNVFHRGYETDQLLVCGDLFPNNLQNK